MFARQKWWSPGGLVSFDVHIYTMKTDFVINFSMNFWSLLFLSILSRVISYSTSTGLFLLDRKVTKWSTAVLTSDTTYSFDS